MLYRRLADFIMVVHFLIAIFCVLGAAFTWRSPWIAFVHVPLVIWVCAASVLGWNCPLTPLENRLRVAAGGQGYEGSFVDHYLRFGPNKGRKDGVWIALWIGCLNAILYASLFLSQR